MPDHKIFMQRCLDLARNGAGTVSPNPMVGSVIVHNNKIIGEGWHYKSGMPHAEVNAINSVKDDALLKESTIYVSLEPCSHYGKTPPCANLIIDKEIPNVVVACLDPNPAVAGSGVNRMEEAGIKVITGVLEKEALEVNRKFITYHQKKRPFITLKWAQSTDGFMDIDRSKGVGGQFMISGQESKVFVHKLRTEHDAILIGTNTALNDDPQLSVREFTGKSPIRLILDRHQRLPQTLKVFSDGSPTLHFVAEKNKKRANDSIEITDPDFVKGVLEYCYNTGIQSILVEGGSAILGAFIQSDYWDEAFVISAPKKMGSGLVAPLISGAIAGVQHMGNDLITSYRNHGLSDN